MVDDSFDGGAGVAAGRFFDFIDGDDEADLFVRDFFIATDLVLLLPMTVFNPCNDDDDDGDSCFTFGLTSTSDTNPESFNKVQSKS